MMNNEELVNMYEMKRNTNLRILKNEGITDEERGRIYKEQEQIMETLKALYELYESKELLRVRNTLQEPPTKEWADFFGRVLTRQYMDTVCAEMVDFNFLISYTKTHPEDYPEWMPMKGIFKKVVKDVKVEISDTPMLGC